MAIEWGGGWCERFGEVVYASFAKSVLIPGLGVSKYAYGRLLPFAGAFGSSGKKVLSVCFDDSMRNMSLISPAL